MILIKINGTDRTSNINLSTIQKTNEIQQRTDSLDFTVFSGSKPTENQDVKRYNYDSISSQVGNTIVLKGYFERNVGYFYVGQILFLGIGDADEERVIVQAYNETTLTITLTATPVGTFTANDKIGELTFGGVISEVEDGSVGILQNLEYNVQCVDYSKIFDKKLISDTWANKDCRYIINDFVNTTVNYNSTLDNLSYANNTAIQAEWIEASDGGNPTVDSSDYIESTSSGVFGWTFAGGTAIWEGTPVSKNISDLVGANSGSPTKGFLMLWTKPSDYTKITSIKIRIGSDAANYAEITIENPTMNDWQYRKGLFSTATVVGNPDWTAVDYAQIRIVETATSSIKLNGIRVNSNNSFTLYNVESTISFSDIRSPQVKPTSFMQVLAKALQCVWYIDYEHDIHFKDKESDPSPFSITTASNNFDDLQVKVDTSQVGNRVIVRGGEAISSSRYAQVVQGDSVLREWILKNKFSSLIVTIDNNSTTHAAEVGTTTTNIKITGHGLSSGDHIVNRTRSVVREITVVDVDNFTVETVASQTNGDTISFFSISVTDGVEGIDDEASFDYMGNSNEKSVRASTQTATLTSTSYIRFSYFERIPIQLQYQDTGSVNSLKALGFGDGIFDLDPITDRNIQDIGTALALAQAKVADYSNALISGSFRTDKCGLRAGQIINISETTRSPAINDNFVIQKVKEKIVGGQYNDYSIFSIEFGTTLFGIIEFFQKLLSTQDRIESNTDAIVETYVSSVEEVDFDDVDAVALNGGFKKVAIAEEVGFDDVDAVTVMTSGTWQYEPSVGQPIPSRFDLADYG